jgi:ATPase subunit of ABC transporter with duplicated ATPase domains
VAPAGARIVLCPQTVDRPGGAPARAEADDRVAHRLRAALGLDPDELARWGTLSPGERKRWQIASALHEEPDVLLLDEPTNHLDAAGRALLLDALRAFRGVGVVVSHDRELLEALAARTARLEAGALRAYDHGYGAARALWEGERREAWDRRDAAQAEARRLHSLVVEARRDVEAAHRSRSLHGVIRHDHDARTLGRRNLAEWAARRHGADVRRLSSAASRAEEAIEDAPALRELGRSVFVGWERAARPVLLALEEASLRAGAAEVLRDVRVAVRREDRIWVQGANGAGKTTLLGALLGRATLPPERLLHLPQELAPGESARLLAAVRDLPADVRGRVLSLVAALGSDPARLLASAEPSPGEARKLALALGMGRHAWALVLDEPTNHLDLPTIERLEAALAAYPGALLLVTHDARLAERCTTARWRVEGGGVHRG